MKRKTKNAVAITVSVLATALLVGGVAYLTKGFTTVDPISDLTKRGVVVYKLEKTVNPLNHTVTFDIADDDQESISGGNFTTTVCLDSADEFIENEALTISDIQNLGYFSTAQSEHLAAQESATDVLNIGTLFYGSYDIHEWTSSSEENTKLKAFDTVRLNIDLAEKALLVSSAAVEEVAGEGYVKKFAKIENITSLHTYIDIDMSEIGEDGSVDALSYQIVGLGGNVIPDLEIKSIELVNKACAYDFVSFQTIA